MYDQSIYVGTAGWSIPAAFAPLFPTEAGSHLERYARALSGVEINSSFYRDHLPKTYARWAASVPPDFRFSVKLAKEITHEHRLEPPAGLLAEKFEGYCALGAKLGVVLIQLPPSLEFDARTHRRFFSEFRKVFAGFAAIEPRHPSWTSAEARRVYRDFRITKVIADPERCPVDDFSALTAGGLFYFRLHGSPVLYRSEYSQKVLSEFVTAMEGAASQIPGWAIFDNTTFGFASRDALWVKRTLERRPRPDGRTNSLPPPVLTI